MRLSKQKPAPPSDLDLSPGDRAVLLDTPRPLWIDSLGRAGIRSAQVLLVIAVVALVVVVAVRLTVVVVPVVLALIISSAVRPLVSWMVRHRVPALLATWIALFAGLAVLGGIITLVVFGVRSEWPKLVKSVSDGLDAVQDFLKSSPLGIDTSRLEELRDSVVKFLTSPEFSSGAIAGVGNAIEVVTSLVLMLVLLFYFLKEGPFLWEFVTRGLRPRQRSRAARIGNSAVGVLGGYVRGTAIVAAVDAIVIGLGLWILQVPLAMPLALLVFVGAFIPIVGATVTGTIAALVALVTNDLTTALIVVAIVIGVNQLEGNFLSPQVLGKSLKLHPIVILVALTVGTVLAGIIGAFLAVPIAAVAWAIIKAWDDTDVAPVRPRPRDARA
ncbi:AI-2E family transporter [Salinibacterium hongtaonis]|uniref:AI-2E family transporter n=1 Tax=Homoserinimonas hongtaonis TaxID=2079791 RepID=UPI000D38369E|nr:AI-2E family transporter [Salinibacterium hongtaonis]AWB90187.1 AI-2E family transporter [Salinibacterium hongtaonis]